MVESPHVDYTSVAREAGLDDEGLGIVEQLFGIAHTNDLFASQLNVYSACESIRDGRVSLKAIRRLVREQHTVEADIRAAFEGVTREGGISWNEAWSRDLNCDDESSTASAADTEQSWHDLVDDPNWFPFPGAWTFLDKTGFRYYIAPAMIRATRCGDDALEHALDYPTVELKLFLEPQQLNAIERFLRFILSVGETVWPGKPDLELRALHHKWQLQE